jgi:hypothetical protein
MMMVALMVLGITMCLYLCGAWRFDSCYIQLSDYNFTSVSWVLP